MNKDFEALKPYLDKEMALSTALGLFEWDNETEAPKEAVERTAKVIGIISGEVYSAIMNDEVKRLVYKLSEDIKNGKASDLTDVEKAIVKEIKKEYDKLLLIPEKEYREFSELLPASASKWAKARKNKDYSEFMPMLAKVIDYTKRFAAYRAKEGEKPYDVLLNDFEEGFNSEILDKFFDKLKKNIVPLLKKIQAKPQVEYSFLFRKYDLKKQEKFSKFIAEYVGFDFDKGVIGVTEHPFTLHLHNKDVRISTHYYENNLESSIFSTIHEAGHALYEMDIPDEMTQTVVGTGSSMGLHESQSRFLENIVGRNKAFWEPVYDKLTKLFSDELKDISLDKFITAINRAEAIPIRTEADELTYSLHIMVRYEIEKKIFNEDYPVEKLPELWNKLYEEYLGVKPEDDAEGILQDIHWSQGSFGYFPSYALGSAVAAQLFHQMKTEMNVEEILRNGELGKIVSWLSEKVHKYGKTKNTNEVLKLATREEFNEDYYIEYLTKKFVSEYSL